MMARPARGLGAGAKPLLLVSGERASARDTLPVPLPFQRGTHCPNGRPGPRAGGRGASPLLLAPGGTGGVPRCSPQDPP